MESTLFSSLMCSHLTKILLVALIFINHTSFYHFSKSLDLLLPLEPLAMNVSIKRPSLCFPLQSFLAFGAFMTWFPAPGPIISHLVVDDIIKWVGGSVYHSGCDFRRSWNLLQIYFLWIKIFIRNIYLINTFWVFKCINWRKKRFQLLQLHVCVLLSILPQRRPRWLKAISSYFCMFVVLWFCLENHSLILPFELNN